MAENTPVIAPAELAAAAAQALAAGIKLRVGVVYTTEIQDWPAVQDWHRESDESLRRKFVNSAVIMPLGPGRILLFSAELTRDQLGHNIRSALGFADLPTRIGLAALPENGDSADALLISAFGNAIK
jgi:hypothetical protein